MSIRKTIDSMAAPLDNLRTGMILLWSGAIVDIPSGWAICDGTNGTPDLRDSFIVGAGSTYAVGATGGSTTHNHTVAGTTGNDTDAGLLAGAIVAGAPVALKPHVHTFSGTTTTKNHLPPYYALAYIMKL